MPNFDDPNYEVRDAEMEELLKRFGRELKAILPPSIGYTLFLFDYGEKGNMFYLSTAQRADMIEGLKEFLARPENKDYV